MASARRPRGLPSISVFLSTGAASPLATDPTAATSAVSASNAVVHGLVVVVPPPVLPPPVLPPLLLLPPPPHAARNTETNAAMRRARVRDIWRLSTIVGAGTPNKKPRSCLRSPGVQSISVLAAG